MTNSPCYKENKKITVKGLMLHSVGCAQPSAEVFIKRWNVPTNTKKCIHAFIDANTGVVYQTLPWNINGWHAGGSANNTHIGVEMCEPDCIEYIPGSSNFKILKRGRARTMARRTYMSAVTLFAQLCEEFGLDPLRDIVSHSEGHAKGIASGHRDPEHLWKQLGLSYTMNGFRKDVAKHMKIVSKAAYTDDHKAWKFFKSKNLNDFAVAGIMGNLANESGIRSNNLQNSYERPLGMNDDQYTKAVDSGRYSKEQFVRDKAGYGLAQWTFWSRKQNLYEYLIENKKVSIGDFDGQLEFLWIELSSKPEIMNVLRTAKSVKEASDVMLLKFERPANQTEANCINRANSSQRYYDTYSNVQNGVSAPKTPFRVYVPVDNLNIRKGPGINYEKIGQSTGVGTFTIVDISTGSGATNGWGKLKSGLGWISLDYCSIK